jgi:UDP-N-acetyl-D-glucosamine dehydrogenase
MKTTETKEKLLSRISDKSAHVCIIGLGYVGLPLASVFGNAGFRVTGIDLNAQRVSQLNSGKSYIEDIPDSVVAQLLKKGLLKATTDFSVLADVDAISICVPTPLRKTGDPDISYIANAAEQIARYFRQGKVIVLESTSYPGTTREILLPQLEKLGLKVGKDFFLAFSPERVDPGRTDWTTINTPKVVGGTTPACLEVATKLYASAIKNIVPVSSPEAAEMAKLLENTFRAVNIGLVNEVMLMCDKLGLDVWEVIDAAASKPFGFMKFKPGPGLGGHCIPIDPLYLSWKLKTLNYTARFIELASDINTGMPLHWVQKTQDRLNDVGKALKGSKILILGLAYKKDVSDVRESPALDIIRLLEAKGAQVQYHDPYVPTYEHDGFNLKSVADLDGVLREVDCLVIVTDHTVYDIQKIQAQARLVVDTRGVVRRHHDAVTSTPHASGVESFSVS